MSGVVDYRSLYFPPMSGRMVAYNETGGNYSSLAGAIIVGYLPTLFPYLHHVFVSLPLGYLSQESRGSPLNFHVMQSLDFRYYGKV
jgi:hypothetical protein